MKRTLRSNTNNFNNTNTVNENNLNTEQKQQLNKLKGMAKKYEGTPGCLSVIFPAVIMVTCYGCFEWLQKLERPGGTIFYLICLCIFFTVYALFMHDALMDGTELPLSEDVKKALQQYQGECINRAKLASIKPSPAAVEAYRRRLREEEREAAEKQERDKDADSRGLASGRGY